MIRFLAFVSSLLSLIFAKIFVGNLYENDYFIATIIAIFCLSVMFLFLGTKSYAFPDERKTITKGRGYKASLLIGFTLIFGMSGVILERPVYDIPNSVFLDDSLRIGDTSYYKNNFSDKEISSAIQFIKDGKHITNETSNNTYAVMYCVFFIFSVYLFMITNNGYWNNRKTFALIILVCSFSYVLSEKEKNIEGNFDYVKNYDLLEFKKINYPSSAKDCEKEYTVKTKSRYVTQEKKDEYVVSNGDFSTRISVSKGETENKFKPGYSYQYTIDANSISNSECDNSDDDRDYACKVVQKCLSAVYYLNNKDSNKYELLSFEDLKNIY